MTTTARAEPWMHGEATVNGVRLHYVEEGRGPLVVLLHGFPEFWYAWRHQIPALAAAGYHVVAPDMRGYNSSEKPPGVAAYAVDVLVEDVCALIRHFGAERAVVVGHDWGGGVAWGVGMNRPEVVEKLIVLNAPHPAAFLRELRSPGQLLRSSYMLFFQLPVLPEATFRAGGFALLERTLRTDPVRPHAFDERDIRRYKRALAQPGALTATINYYRALLRERPRETLAEPPTITRPTLLIWGDQDRYLGTNLAHGLDRWVTNLRVEHIPDASHWVQADRPERVSELMIEFMRDA
jgi:epoxide hydrolase 4